MHGDKRKGTPRIRNAPQTERAQHNRDKRRKGVWQTRERNQRKREREKGKAKGWKEKHE